MADQDSSPRIAIFTHDTYGLGHVRRTLRIAHAVAERVPDAGILVVTGSPALQVLRDLPRNADVVKIPTIVRTGARGARPPHLAVSLDHVSRLRRRLIKDAVLTFAPDVFLVDNFPLGSRRELLSTLRALRDRPTRTVLGLRDILDSPDVVRADWARQGIYEVLDECYDRILVYGMPEILDVVEAYELPASVAPKIQYCGYVTSSPQPQRSASDVRRDLRVSGPFVLCTGGGGGDGFPLLDVFLKTLPLLPDLWAVVSTGPLMSETDRSRLRAQVNGNERLVMRDFIPDLPSVLAAADVVVAMCGYNTASEIASVGARAVVVPRTWRYGEHRNRESAAAEWEQTLRAQALADLGLVQAVAPEELTPERLAATIERALGQPPVSGPGSLMLGGVEVVADHIVALAREPKEAAGVG